MNQIKPILAYGLALLMTTTPGFSSSHREAPITALDRLADITDIYAFRSYDGGATPRVTLIMCVDPLQEPGNGPNWFPFDPEVFDDFFERHDQGLGTTSGNFLRS